VITSTHGDTCLFSSTLADDAFTLASPPFDTVISLH
jgi:hypothetical protein